MRILGVTSRLLKQLVHEKRMLIFFVFSPIISISIFYFVFNANEERIRIGMFVPSEIMLECPIEKDIICKVYINEQSLSNDLKHNKIDLAINFESTIKVSTAALVYQKSQAHKNFAYIFLSGMKEKNSLKETPIEFKNVYPIEKFNFFETLAPFMMALIIFCLVFICSGMAFFAEKDSGTLARLMLTPLKPIEFLLGYFIAFGILVSIQTAVLQIFCFKVLGLSSNANFMDVVFVGILVAIMGLSIGLFFSIFAKSQFEISQVIPIVLLPQLALSGLFDISGSKTLTILSDCLPLKYVSNIMANLILKGEPLSMQYNDIMAIAGFTIFFAFLTTFYIKKYKS